MSDIYIADQMRKNLRERKAGIMTTLSHGVVTDWLVFKELRAQLREIEKTEQDLNELLKKLGTTEDD